MTDRYDVSVVSCQAAANHVVAGWGHDDVEDAVVPAGLRAATSSS